MKTATLTYSITINASQQTVYDYVSDWEKQSDWIKFTTVHVLSDFAANGEVHLLAITQLGPLKLKDTMVITELHPPDKIIVEHTGRLILGKGIFGVRSLSAGSCEFTWHEITPVPFGRLGMALLPFVKPLLKIPFNMSLRKLKSSIESTI